MNPPSLRWTASKANAETLQHLSDLLHLFQHRNKNQHRRSIWWRHFSVFRKQLNALALETCDLNAVPPTHLAKARKKAHDLETRQKIEQRLKFWQDVMVPKWQHAFSQVVADGRFAVLGVVLLSVLAEVCKITGIIANLEDLGQAEVERVLERFAQEGWEDDGSETGRFSSPRAMNEDTGEVVNRAPATGDSVTTTLQSDTVTEDVATPEIPLVPTTTIPSKRRQANATKTVAKKKKKQQRKGDAIDDLFGGLD